MGRLLLFSIVAAIVAVGAVAYQLMPRGGRRPEPIQQQAATPSSIRSIPIAPRDESAPLPAPAAPANSAKSTDVLGDVSRTLGELRTQEEADGARGSALTAAQVEALKAQAERRHVRPVTRMNFPLEPGTTVPPQVFLHPTPPELAGVASASDPAGFIQVGDKFVLVGTVSRRILAVSKG